MAQTYTDTNVNQLTINKLNKTEYNNLPQVSDTELYLVEEQIDDTPTENSANPVSSGGVFEALQSCTQTAPLGAILPFAGSTIPTNWMLCDGSAISRTTYAELFAVIGTNFGTGDGSTTFNLPDLREATTKGAGLSGQSNNHYSNDGIALGEFVEDRFQNHSHLLSGGSNSLMYTTGDNFLGIDTNYHGDSTAFAKATTISEGRSGNTTEVKAVGVNYIIRVLGGSSETPEQPINYNNIPIVFTPASAVNNITSGETLSELFGQIQKNYSQTVPIDFKLVTSLVNTTEITSYSDFCKKILDEWYRIFGSSTNYTIYVGMAYYQGLWFVYGATYPGNSYSKLWFSHISSNLQYTASYYNYVYNFQ